MNIHIYKTILHLTAESYQNSSMRLGTIERVKVGVVFFFFGGGAQCILDLALPSYYIE